MRILIIADIDDLHWKLGSGQADILLSCGDVCDQVILEAAAAFGCKRIFAVKGNHDRDVPFEKPIIDLHLKTLCDTNLQFAGMNGSWKYKDSGSFMYEQHEADALLSQLPPVDIMLSHNSPRGIHDKEDNIHFGFEGLTSYIMQARPKMLIHGHQHINQETIIAGTRVVGIHGHKVIEIYGSVL